VLTHLAVGLAAVAVKRACAAHKEEDFKFLYPLELSIQDKIEKIAKDIYGAAEVTYSEEALAKIELFTKCGYGALPICMAKTHLSLSADATAKNVPTGFTIPIRDIRCSAGAGFIYPLVRLKESGLHLDECFCRETRVIVLRVL
jgi:methylenetetrahydrofolate dehydrogenase (NADP+)/methenyltetrahydrofolate cyclohydrolase/formyltetrahydrofolate synthetase